jgi:hypothetical protein
VIGAPGCAVNSSVRQARLPQRESLPPTAVVFVMAPIVEGSASPGNVGRDFVAIKADVASKIISVVRERFPRAELAQSGWPAGATHLLVPTITEWKEMRTDDPLGALILPHNSITITLRLMRLQPPPLVGEVTFHNRARLTSNRTAIRLLDERFRQAVLLLLAG